VWVVRVGVPREIREEEYRVALTPAGTKELTARGHEVLVESKAGLASQIPDEAYVAAGAKIVSKKESLFAEADLIVKVKEPLPEETELLEPRHVLFTFLHLAPDAELTDGLLRTGATCVAYETVESEGGRKPILAPMSEIAGRVAPQAGAHFLERGAGGKGKLLCGATGVKAANVVILGAGAAGFNAAMIASGLGAHVKLLDIAPEAIQAAAYRLPQVQTLHSDRLTIEEEVIKADLVIGAVLVSGAMTPVLVSEALVEAMPKGSVIVDVSIDQGGCFETSHPTNHRRPTFVKHGVVHYCVDNIAGVVPVTSTYALTNATLPYITEIADKGIEAAVRADSGLAKGVNIMEGKITREEVAAATGHQHFPLEYVLPIDYL
jgi:alanine dehydrogenase